MVAPDAAGRPGGGGGGVRKPCAFVAPSAPPRAPQAVAAPAGLCVALARDMGVHPTYPGKLLLSRTEELTPERREWLLARNCPEELLE